MENLSECDQPIEIKKALYQMSMNPNGFMLLLGTNGTGKTYAAKCIYNLVNPFSKVNGHDSDEAIFITQSDLNIKFLEKSSEGKITHLLEPIKKTRLLVLDDFGTRQPTGAFLDFIYAIIDSRFDKREKQGTVITSNLDSKDIEKYFGNAIVSRISSNYIINFTGQDRRELQQKLIGFPTEERKYFKIDYA